MPEFETFLLANEDAKSDMGAALTLAPWEGSPFEWLLTLPSRKRGKAGELLVSHWLGRMRYQVDSPASSGHDRIVEGRSVEIKMSTLWGSGDYVFQQLRDQDYEFVILLGISPPVAHVWIVPKHVAWEAATPQHGGAEGTDTRWIHIRADQPPEWLAPFGGSLETAAEVAESTFKV
jgi:hypothetical protein